MKDWKNDENPLRDTFKIKVNNVDNMGKTADELKKMDKVDTVQYGEGMVEKLVNAFSSIEKVAYGVVIALIIVTIFLIINTIKLTIFARKNEIEIMRLVGTSNFTIKLPFVIEGLFLGMIGSLIPILATIWGYIFAFDKLEGHLFTNYIRMITPIPFVFYTSIALLIIGSLVGMFGSYITVRKYLKI